MRSFRRSFAPVIFACLSAGCVLSEYEVADSKPEVDAGTEEPIVKSDKIDVLLMVDNSPSMADKQWLLSEVVPDLVQAVGSLSEDVHYGVITSSLGAAGSDACEPEPGTTRVDMAHLVTRDDPLNPSSTTGGWQGKGFLFWDPSARGTPPGESTVKGISDQLRKFVTGATEFGCGFEASLESWYRFLADPVPYAEIVAGPCASGGATDCRTPSGVDAALLQQRANFLRPDSLVLIVMLTDENDCSVMVGGQNHMILQQYTGAAAPFHMHRSTSACDKSPASPDCKSCFEPGTESDPECMKGVWGDKEDPGNLRCYRQKQRFGIDFLYPVNRYVSALKSKRMTAAEAGAAASNGMTEWVNPLFCGKPSADWQSCEGQERSASQVVLAGMVGVPWQDIARSPADLSQGLLPAKEINWAWIVGDWQNYGDPQDPLMIESRISRWGDNPATGAPLVGMEADKPTANPINGHEWDAENASDLQYACIFPLPVPRECAQSGAVACDCGNAAQYNPLCQDATGQYSTLQRRAKAYPSIRPLAVMQGLGERAVVGSICPSNTLSNSAPDYAYRPVVKAIVDVIKPRLN